MDPLAGKKRHKIMASIHSQNTKPEIILRKKLWHMGIRYRKNYKALIGSPDIAITRFHIAIFIDGDFWHGKDFSTIEKRLDTNKSYWVDKLKTNMERDKFVNDTLTEMGWIVLRYWESDVEKNANEVIGDILQYLPPWMRKRAGRSSPYGNAN